jgi:ABC-2 type transport system ATP-binding protein
LDEPLITLDAPTVTIIQKIIRQYHEAGVSFLISSHQLFDEPAKLLPTEITISNQTLS